MESSDYYRDEGIYSSDNKKGPNKIPTIDSYWITKSECLSLPWFRKMLAATALKS